MGEDFQALCEIAERELNLGLADPALVERSLREANGVEAQGRQIFWQLRAKQLQALDEADLRALVANIDAQQRRWTKRKKANRWFWAAACLLGVAGAGISSVFALRAVGKPGPAFAIFAVLSVASVALTIVAFIASGYHTHTD